MTSGPVFTPGQPLPAEKIQQLGSEVQTYTPALTAASSNPTLGSGSTAQGLWTQQGGIAMVWWDIGFGSSGVGAGSGIYRVSLPVDIAPGALARISVGSGVALDSSVATDLGSSVFTCRMAAGLPDRVVMAVEESTLVTAAAPFAWAAGDSLTGFCAYPGDF